MSASFDRDSNCKDGPAAIYPVAGSMSHEAVSADETARPVSAALSSMPAALRPIDIDPIRWGWWMAGFCISAALWACIAIGMF